MVERSRNFNPIKFGKLRKTSKFDRNYANKMKNILFVLAILFQIASYGQAVNMAPRKQHEYFVRENQIPAYQSLISRAANGDTVLTSYFKFNNPASNGFQEFTRVYKGTPFFQNKWSKGSFNNINGKPIPFLIAYNIEKSMVYYVNEGLNQTVEVKPDEFTIDNHFFKAYGKTKTYFEVMHDGKWKLLKQHVCTNIKTNINDDSGYDVRHEDDYEGTFMKSNKYFLLTDDDPKIIEKKEKFVKFFGKIQSEISQFITENQLSTKSESDLLKIFKFAEERQKSL